MDCAIKTTDQLSGVECACRVTRDLLDRLEPMVTDLDGNRAAELTEKSLALLFDDAVRDDTRLEGLAFDSIVAVNGHAQTLHHVPTADTVIRPGDTVLIDVGARAKGGMCADHARTWVAGSSTSRTSTAITHLQQQQRIDALHRALLTLIDEARPGVTWEHLEARARELLRPVYKLCGVPPDTTMPHKVGHHVGKEVHDPCDYERPLAENMTIALEIGVYTPQWGMRVEHTMRIMPDGAPLVYTARHGTTRHGTTRHSIAPPSAGH